MGSLFTGLRVLEALALCPDGLNLTELSTTVDKDKGNLHRLLQTLVAAGYLEQHRLTKRYVVTAQVVTLAGKVLQNLDLVQMARPLMRELSQSTGESVHLARRTKSGGVYVAQERSPNALNVDTEIGTSVPLHSTSTGKALLAGMPRDEIRDLLPSPLALDTIRTHRTVDSLIDDLHEVAVRGYAIDDEEHNPGVRCVAAPIRGADDVTLGSIGISGPAERIGLSRLAELGGIVRDAAASISSSMKVVGSSGL